MQDGRDGAFEVLTAWPASGIITVWVVESWGKEGCLKGGSRVDASKELANEHETVVETSHVAEQVPNAVPSALLDNYVVR